MQPLFPFSRLSLLLSPHYSFSSGFSYHHIESSLIEGRQSCCILGLVQLCMMGNYIGMHTWVSSLYSKRAMGICLTLSGDVSVGICFEPCSLPIPTVRLRQQCLQCSAWHTYKCPAEVVTLGDMDICVSVATILLLQVSAFLGCYFCPINSTRPCPPEYSLDRCMSQC